MKKYIAIDIGVSSLKLLVAGMDGKQIRVYREQKLLNKPLEKNGNQFIDIFSLLEQIKNSIKEISFQEQQIFSIGIDTYGNGYALLNEEKSLIELPYFYKDDRTIGILEKISKRISLREIYQQTGLYPTEIRVLMQLFLEVLNQTFSIRECRYLLLFPDLLIFLLTGEIKAERSMASVASLLSSGGDDWCSQLFECLSIPVNIFPPLVEGGSQESKIPLMPNVIKELGCKEMGLVHVTSHDTESALLAAPMLDQGYLFISIGSSVICGARTPQPVICDGGYLGRFKNVRGAFEQNSLCRDFSGLWLLEKCLRFWRKMEPDIGYAEIITACENSEDNDTYFDVCSPGICTCPDSLIENINEFCRKTGQTEVHSIGEIATCIFESITLEILWTFNQIKGLTLEQDFLGVSAIGGGVHNRILMQMIADAIQLPVYVGSDFSAAIGNVLMQMISSGELLTKRDVKDVAANSCGMSTFDPNAPSAKWDIAIGRLLKFKCLNIE